VATRVIDPPVSRLVKVRGLPGKTPICLTGLPAPPHGKRYDARLMFCPFLGYWRQESDCDVCGEPFHHPTVDAVERGVGRFERPPHHPDHSRCSCSPARFPVVRADHRLGARTSSYGGLGFDLGRARARSAFARVVDSCLTSARPTRRVRPCGWPAALPWVTEKLPSRAGTPPARAVGCRGPEPSRSRTPARFTTRPHRARKISAERVRLLHRAVVGRNAELREHDRMEAEAATPDLRKG
jgi:hypothetical protein